MIEVGIPFSDPLADGPVIQHSSETAIANGATVSLILDRVREAREKTGIPIILMGYINPILRYGMENFLREAHDAGVDGVIIPDLPPEESGEFRTLSRRYGVSNVFLIAPTTTDERIAVIDALSTDFSYCVSVTGVTGSPLSEQNSLSLFLDRVRRNTKKPFVVGFGISTKDQVDRIVRSADGVVIGSALVSAIGTARSVPEAAETAASFLSSVR